MHKVIQIKDPNDIQQLYSYLEAEYLDEAWMNDLASSLSPELKAILIEYPYVDKDYRSTYYNFYAKKGRKYGSLCVRIHFFGSEISLNENLKIEGAENLDETYLGFIVLRPTEVNPIGRSAISPRLINNFKGYIMVSEHFVHLLGYTFKILAFPFMSQHTDVSVCAHVACWSILRYYNQKFPLYAEYLTYDITKMAADIAEGGLLPSRGLDVEHATKILGRGGSFPDLYAKESFGAKKFYRLLYSYIESGFPIFAAMHCRGHAISIIGHGPILNHSASTGTPREIRYSWDHIGSLVVVDDNYLPYKVIRTAPATGDTYSVEDIDAFVVPLPEKVYFPSEAVMVHTEMLLAKNDLIDLSYIDQPIVRYFLTTASSYKKYLWTNNEIPRELFLATIELSMPKFIWVAEVTDGAGQEEGRTLVSLIFDATANKYENMPFFVIHDQNHVVVFDRVEGNVIGKIDFKQRPISYPLYQNNLFPYS